MSSWKANNFMFETLKKKVGKEMEKMKKQIRQMERPKELGKPLQDR